MFEKLDKSINKIMTSPFIIVILSIIGILASLILPWCVAADELSSALQNITQVIIAVAIGLGTLVIALKAKESEKRTFAKRILVLLIISALSFMISFYNLESIQRLYLSLSGMVLFVTISTTARYIEEHNRKN